MYAHLEIDVKRHLNYDWPSKLGIDEHGFGKNKYNNTVFNTVFTDIQRHQLYRVGSSKNAASLFEQFKDITGGNKVTDVTIDMSEGFRSLTHALSGIKGEIP